MRSKQRAGGRGAARFLFKGKGMLYRVLPWILCGLLVISLFRMEQKIRPAAEKACAYECRSLASAIVAESVARTLESAAASDLSITMPVYDGTGAVTAIHTSPEALNAVQTMLLEHVNASLENSRNAEFSVHFGTLTGLYTLSGRGPEIPLRFTPMGVAQVSLDSSFSDGGINQTVHRLTAVITVDVGCSVPLYHAEETVSFSYLLAETVIVGDVPAVTWSGKSLPGA